MSKWVGLCLWIGICFVAAAIGSWFTVPSVRTWYSTLMKPAGTPPSWAFGPVWSMLYVLMGTAAWLIWRQRTAADVRVALVLFIVQLALNATWSFVFFGLRRPGLALLEILVLLAAIIATTANFAQFSRTACWLMTPYAAWVSYATYLNFGVWRLNGGAR